MTYNGNCHCGANRFEVELPEIATSSSCKCSLCFKKGYLWVTPEEGSLRFTRGDDGTLTKYASAALEHWVYGSSGPPKLLTLALTRDG